MSGELSKGQLDRSFAVSVGRRIAAVRGRAGRSQGEVAEALGYSLSSVSAWERGSREPGLRALADLARFLETTVGVFFPTAEEGWAAPVEDTDGRLQRLERQVGTLRTDYYRDRDHLVNDGLLEAR